MVAFQIIIAIDRSLEASVEVRKKSKKKEEEGFAIFFFLFEPSSSGNTSSSNNTNLMNIREYRTRLILVTYKSSL